MDYGRMIEEMKAAWDALESMCVQGYAARVRITRAQENILSVYNALCAARKAAEKEEPGEDPEE